VIEGTLTCRVGDDQFEAGAGSLVWLPREIPHTFANLSDTPVRVLGVTVPAGLEGMFEEQGAYFAGLTGPPDQDVVAGIGSKYA
jgi:quercetin dioxygenase-like cupin family protein